MSDEACLARARQVDASATLCSEEYCLDPAHAPTLHAYCNCKPPYPERDPCPWADDTPVPMPAADPPCFCCCVDAYRAPCVATLHARHPGAKLCSRERCLEEPSAAWLSELCHCPKEFATFPCSYHPENVVPWSEDGEQCWCCCGDYPDDARAAAGDEGEEVPAARLEPGDPVRAADAGLRWRTATVAFSQGAPVAAGQALRLVYGRRGHVRLLAVSRDALLLVEGGGLKRASALVAGQDRLVTPRGDAIELLGVETVEHATVLHHLGTSAEPAAEMDGHLLAVNGVVMGDWALQLGWPGEEG